MWLNMWKIIKIFLKKILPIPANKYYEQYNYLINKINNLETILNNLNIILSNKLDKTNSFIYEKIDNDINKVLINTINEKFEKMDNDSKIIAKKSGMEIDKLNNSFNIYSNLFKDNLSFQGETQKIVNEILWANIFNDAISNSPWLIDKTFYPGRWAVGYPFLYVLYRILYNCKPKRILELGLGETTKLISQYVLSDNSVEHLVVESDNKWISFFSNEFKLPSNTKIINLPCKYITFKDSKKVRVYEYFEENLAYGKYDLICIDGPMGGDLEKYSRIDVLSLIPDNISESYIILLDDYERQTEKNTVEEILNKLKNCRKGYYPGKKDMIVLFSNDYNFLATM